MRRDDTERLSREYAADAPRNSRLAAALNVDLPVWHALASEIIEDLDGESLGIGWWVPNPGTSRRVLISDHLFVCAQSVTTNLVEARLHLLEAADFWERENDFNARAVSITRDRRIGIQVPNRMRPVDDVQSSMVTLHTVGFIRAIAGALDCLGAVIVGVAALKVNILRADLDRARRALGRIGGAGRGEQLQRDLNGALEAAINESGPSGWLPWATDLRNMLIHRGRRLWISELRPMPSSIISPGGEPVIRTDVIHLLPRDPGKSDVEMFLSAGTPPVLTESAEITLRGILESTLSLLERSGHLLLNLWRTRRADPGVLTQPREQWPDGPSSTVTGFAGFAPDSAPYTPDHFRSNETLLRRISAASVDDAKRDAWKTFD